MNDSMERLKVIGAELRRLFPDAESASLEAVADGRINIHLHRCGDYVAATEIFRRLDLGDRNKRLPDEQGQWSVIDAKDANICVTAYIRGLPPSCKLVHVTEQIPKRQTIDTGEFIEVNRVKIVCGNGEPSEAEKESAYQEQDKEWEGE